MAPWKISVPEASFEVQFWFQRMLWNRLQDVTVSVGSTGDAKEGCVEAASSAGTDALCVPAHEIISDDMFEDVVQCSGRLWKSTDMLHEPISLPGRPLEPTSSGTGLASTCSSIVPSPQMPTAADTTAKGSPLPPPAVAAAAAARKAGTAGAPKAAELVPCSSPSAAAAVCTYTCTYTTAVAAASSGSWGYVTPCWMFPFATDSQDLGPAVAVFATCPRLVPCWLTGPSAAAPPHTYGTLVPLWY